MKKYLVLILVPFFLSFSNRINETAVNKIKPTESKITNSDIDLKELYGDWYFEKEIMSENLSQNFNYYPKFKSFKIINDSIIDFKIPFLYAIDTKIKNENDEYVSNSLSLGSESEFTLSNNKIRYLNKENYKWETIFVEKVEDNKLYIKFDVNGNTFVYKKNTSTVLDNTNYDTIILTQGSCFGSCPINSTYLNRNGEFYFKSTEFNTVINGLYSSTLENNQSLKIFNLFDKVYFKNLNEKYTSYQEDISTDVITFVKNNKIVKTIELQNNIPIDLSIANFNFSYLYQKTYLTKQDTCIFQNSVLNGLIGKSILLEDSEIFYLEILLEKGNKGNFVFNKKYNLDFFEWGGIEKIESIFTDGRYYQINYKDNTSVTIDIGFNFIDKNPILKTKKKE